MTIYGSLVGLLTALALGLPAEQIYTGIWGFNAVTVSIAMGGMFYVFNTRVWIMTGVAAFTATVLHAAGEYCG